MSAGLFDYVFEISRVVSETGVTFDEAKEIVYAAHEPKPEPGSNVVYGVDFATGRRKEKSPGAL